jgi:hypothetical protein
LSYVPSQALPGQSKRERPDSNRRDLRRQRSALPLGHVLNAPCVNRTRVFGLEDRCLCLSAKDAQTKPVCHRPCRNRTDLILLMRQAPDHSANGQWFGRYLTSLKSGNVRMDLLPECCGHGRIGIAAVWMRAVWVRCICLWPPFTNCGRFPWLECFDVLSIGFWPSRPGPMQDSPI